jgi:hypothetical protein
MGSPFNPLENGMWISAAVPKDTTGAAYAGDYVNMSNAEELWIMIQQGAWAGGTPAVTIGSGTTAAGGTTAAVTDFEAWSGVALTDDQYAAVTVAAGTFSLTATANTVTLIRVKASAIPAGKKFLRVEVATPGANADLIAMSYLLTGIKYQGEVPPTVIA